MKNLRIRRLKSADGGRPGDLGAHRRRRFKLRIRRMKKQSKKGIIAYRKSCVAKGTGLSHYILMEEKRAKSHGKKRH